MAVVDVEDCEVRSDCARGSVRLKRWGEEHDETYADRWRQRCTRGYLRSSNVMGAKIRHRTFLDNGHY